MAGRSIILKRTKINMTSEEDFQAAQPSSMYFALSYADLHVKSVSCKETLRGIIFSIEDVMLSLPPSLQIYRLFAALRTKQMISELVLGSKKRLNK
jgi:hypothetical protein